MSHIVTFIQQKKCSIPAKNIYMHAIDQIIKDLKAKKHIQQSLGKREKMPMDFYEGKKQATQEITKYLENAKNKIASIETV